MWIRTACYRLVPARSGMALRQILQYPNPLLKQRAQPVANIGGDVVQLVEDMAETMYAAPGVGLAAPQVGVGQRVIVLDVRSAADQPRARGGDRVGGGLPLRPRLHCAGDAGALHPGAGLDARRARSADRGRGAARRGTPARDRPPRREALPRPPLPPEARPLPGAAEEARAPGKGE